MERSVSLTSTHPHQGPGTSSNDYYRKTDFYYNMLGLVEDIRVSLGETYYQDCFISDQNLVQNLVLQRRNILHAY